MCKRRQVSIKIQLSVISILMEGHNVTGIRLVRIYDTGDRWYEENKKKWAKDGALGYTCGYCCVGWGWWVNFNKRCAVGQIGANPRDDIARQTESMLKSVEKCGMVESIKCSGHVESSQNCYFSWVNSFHDVICEFERSGLSGMEFAIGRLQRTETGRYGYMRKKTS